MNDDQDKRSRSHSMNCCEENINCAFVPKLKY